jgi:hypothetical protein
MKKKMNEKLDHDFLVKRNRADLWLRSHIVGIYLYDFHEKYCLRRKSPITLKFQRRVFL